MLAGAGAASGPMAMSWASLGARHPATVQGDRTPSAYSVLCFFWLRGGVSVLRMGPPVDTFSSSMESGAASHPLGKWSGQLHCPLATSSG